MSGRKQSVGFHEGLRTGEMTFKSREPMLFDQYSIVLRFTWKGVQLRCFTHPPAFPIAVARAVVE